MNTPDDQPDYAAHRPEPLKYAKPDIPQPIVEPVMFFTFVLTSGARVDVDVRPERGDTYEEQDHYWLFTFPKIKASQKIQKSQVASVMERVSEIQTPSPEMLKKKEGRRHE